MNWEKFAATVAFWSTLFDTIAILFLLVAAIVSVLVG